MFPSILVVDDEPAIRKSLEGLLSDEGFDVFTAPNGFEALKKIDKELPDLVLLDIWLPGMDGLETLKEIKKNHSTTPVVMITGHGTIETAVQATKLGAFDFLEKPLSIDKVILTINNALNFRKIQEENLYLRKQIIEKNSIDGISKYARDLKQELFKVALSDSWTLIQGESGTGKERIARTIHQLSKRAKNSMIVINCASITEEMISKELFGNEGKIKSKGAFELADGGTIFFDEIGNMSLETQSMLTHFLENQKFKRIGGNRELSVDARIIASTNKNLKKEIKKGNFREDFFFRLNVLPIVILPLRKRKEDIPILIEKFLLEEAKKHNDKKKTISKAALEKLCAHKWSGNVRELKNLIERLVVLVKKKSIRIDDLPVKL